MADLTYRRGVTRAALALAMLPLAGCVTVAGGTPTPNTDSPPPAAVQRPRVLDMANVDPCELLTTEQQRTFGIDLAPRPDDSVIHQARACRFPNERDRISVSFVPIPHTGVDRFADGKVNADVRDITIGGFPAKENFIRINNPSIPPACIVIVDVAPGQVLNATYMENARGGPPVLTRNEVCPRAADAATAAIATLMSKN